MWARPDRLLLLAGAVLFVLFLVALAVAAMDKRLLDGVPVWSKPIKFLIATAVHVLTLGIVVALLSPERQAWPILVWTTLACLACCAFEIAYISLQAARGQHSHFNLGSPLYAALYQLMAAAAVVITCTAAVIGIIAFWDEGARLSLPVRHGILLGFLGGTIFTLVAGFTIGARLSPAVGQVVTDVARMPVTGWRLDVGDLRVAHFLATHMMQSVPLAAVVAALLLPASIATGLVWLFAAGWTCATYLAYASALAGQPLSLPR
ncbi:MAG: hypothetical protein EKK41_27465 [Hyphomicrobiales bacterium]|nr:MAG: hypothetical protein EKK41_27465 [Hyphomicrobiales bacterium]